MFMCNLNNPVVILPSTPNNFKFIDLGKSLSFRGNVKQRDELYRMRTGITSIKCPKATIIRHVVGCCYHVFKQIQIKIFSRMPKTELHCIAGYFHS